MIYFIFFLSKYCQICGDDENNDSKYEKDFNRNKQPRSNRHGRKWSFTEIYGGRTRTLHTSTVYDVKRSETHSVYRDRVKIRVDWKLNSFAPYTELYDYRIRSYITVCDRIWSYTVYPFSDSHWNWVNIQTVSVFSLFCFPFCILAHFDPIVRRTVGIFKFISFIFLF